MTIHDHEDYREFLRGELERRCAQNARYSLRAFARDLQLTPSRLSEVFNRRRGLTPSLAARVALRLALGDGDSRRFMLLVQKSDGRTEMLRAQARREISLDAESLPTALTLDAFRVIQDWYHYAILELTQVSGFRSDPAWIARRLRITPTEVRGALSRLSRLDLLESGRGGKLKRTNAVLTTPNEVVSDSIREFNRQVLSKALHALDSQPLEERDVSTYTMAVDPTRIPEAKKRIRAFRRELGRFLESGKSQRVYCLSVQLFGLDDGSIS